MNRIDPNELVYQLKIETSCVEEMVWRRALVDGLIGLPELHRVIQIVMGWNGAHRHQFIFGVTTFGDSFALDPNIKDEDWYCLATNLACVDRFTYRYGHTGEWRLNITVEKALPQRDCHSTPYLIDGAGVLPAENIDDPARSKYLCTVLSDKDHPHYRAVKERLKKGHATFSEEEVNAALLREFKPAVHLIK